MSQVMEERLCGAGLSSSLMRVIDDAEKIDWLRQILSGFSHRCRNSLNGMKQGFYLCKRESPSGLPAVWHDLEQTYELIERTIEQLQLIYRPITLTQVESKLGTMIAEREASWRSYFAAHGKVLIIDYPSRECPGRFDPMFLGQGLDALVIWRAEASPVNTRVRLGWECRDAQFVLDWNEEEPGFRAECATDDAPARIDPHALRQRQVDSLALPLLARIIRAHDGEICAAPASSRWLRIIWPKCAENRLTVDNRGC